MILALCGPAGGTRQNAWYSAVRIDSPKDSEGGRGKAEAFLGGQRKLGGVVNVKHLISPSLWESSSSGFPSKFQGNLWTMF